MGGRGGRRPESRNGGGRAVGGQGRAGAVTSSCPAPRSYRPAAGRGAGAPCPPTAPGGARAAEAALRDGSGGGARAGGGSKRAGRAGARS